MTNILFQRDRLTWLAYFMLAYYAYLQALLGPLMPFVSAELNLTYTLSGLHLSAFALGMVLAGMLGDRVTERLGRWRTFWGGGLGMAAGALLFVTGQTPGVTITSALIMGALGSLIVVIVQAALSDRHQSQRATALTEANIAASVLAALGPLLIGLSQSSGLGWRAALVIGIGLWGGLLLLYHTVQIPDQTPSAAARDTQNLPRAFWAYWLVIFVSNSIEWSVIFWGASFMESVGGFSKVDAASSMSAFFIAMIIGRTVGSRLTTLYRSRALLVGAIGITLAGFPVFWLLANPVARIGGLFVAGLGIANLFPLTLSAAANVAPGASNKASARILFGAGLAVLIMPQILGSTADTLGLNSAFAIIGALLALDVVLISAAYLLSRAVAPASVPQ